MRYIESARLSGANRIAYYRRVGRISSVLAYRLPDAPTLCIIILSAHMSRELCTETTAGRSTGTRARGGQGVGEARP